MRYNWDPAIGNGNTNIGLRLVRTAVLPVAQAGSAALGVAQAACPTGYHVNTANNVCDADTIACDVSPLPTNATAAAQTWNGTAYGSCNIPTACTSGFHVEGGACMSNVKTCPITGYGTGLQRWSSGTTYGDCKQPNGGLCTASTECDSNNCPAATSGLPERRCAPTGMVYLPPATYTAGSPTQEEGRSTGENRFQATISRGLFIGTAEVTQGEWKALAGGINPAFFQSTTGIAQSTANANDSGPVEQIDWYSAVAFANAKSAADGLTACYILINCDDPIDGWKDGIHAGCNDATFAGVPCTGYRLPTESESQYAARGGTTTATFGGDLSGDTGCVTVSGAGSVLPGTPLSDLAWYTCNAGGRTHQVAAKVANGFGLYDVLGNAWEWTGDWSGNYPASGVSDPTGPATGTGRVLSGCSWNGTAACTRSAIRGYYGSNDRVWDVGFRLVRTAF
jgi:formylglycine-generating enzyme required for sulfatase activity